MVVPQVLDPAKARTMDEFIAQMRLLKSMAGNPSITEITRRIHQQSQRTGRPRTEWPARSTVGNCFRVGRRRPNSDLLLSVVQALVGSDEAVISVWRHSLRAVLGEAEESTRVRAYDRLPPATAAFIGRAGLVAHAEALLTAAPHRATLVLEGMAGVGKTALALHLAHRLLDGERTEPTVLFANLRGCPPQGPPADPAAVLETFLRLLGIPGDRIPYDLHARAALYRQALAGTNALIILDDAADAHQLRPLLPETAGCRTLVTSRRTVPGLAEVTRLQVVPLDPDDSVELLHTTAGTSRITRDVPALRRIAHLLGHLPLALSVIGRHMRDHPAWALDDYYREPLVTLALEDGMRHALATSDARLPAGARRLLRLLALHPLEDVETTAAAALLGENHTIARQHLTALAAVHLVKPLASGRFRVHPLTHAYARERLGIDEPATRIRQALSRLMAHDHGRSSGGARRHRVPSRPSSLPHAERTLAA